VPPRALPRFGADEVEGLADLLCARFGLAGLRRSARLPAKRRVRSVSGEGTEHAISPGRREKMAKTTSRTSARQTGTRSRSAAGRKGGRATLRTRGPEFYSKIGRKGGKSRGLRSRDSGGRGAAGRSPASRRAAGAGKRRGGARSRGRP
jgi:general stress protein YciG